MRGSHVRRRWWSQAVTAAQLFPQTVMDAVIVEPIFAKSVAAVVSISGVAITNDISLPRSGQRPSGDVS